MTDSERIARLEARVDILARQQDEQTQLLREVRDAVVSAKGAKLALIALVSVSGTIGALISQFLPR